MASTPRPADDAVRRARAVGGWFAPRVAGLGRPGRWGESQPGLPRRRLRRPGLLRMSGAGWGPARRAPAEAGGELARPTDALVDGCVARAARRHAWRAGLPILTSPTRVADETACWAALGALGVLTRFADRGDRSAVVVDESGSRSPLRRWARARGLEVVPGRLVSTVGGLGTQVDPNSLDALTRLYPGGCDVDDVDEALVRASTVVRPGGFLALTLPLGQLDGDGGVGAADLRALIARADDLGFALVGDLDLEQIHAIRAAEREARGTAYGLVRLTWRRRGTTA